jgi:hypothetical protein
MKTTIYQIKYVTSNGEKIIRDINIQCNTLPVMIITDGDTVLMKLIMN